MFCKKTHKRISAITFDETFDEICRDIYGRRTRDFK